jgi:hypothetical protein
MFNRSKIKMLESEIASLKRDADMDADFHTRQLKAIRAHITCIQKTHDEQIQAIADYLQIKLVRVKATPANWTTEMVGTV